jgi:transcriptional regulator with XRE-family HTH domain
VPRRSLHPIKLLLAEQHLTYREFAPRVGVTEGVLSGILNGRIATWPAFRRRCADELGLTEDLLFPERLDDATVLSRLASAIRAGAGDTP